MRTQIIFWALFLTFFLSFLPSPARAATGTIAMSDFSVGTGQRITVPLTANITDGNLGGYDIVLYFDPLKVNIFNDSDIMAGDSRFICVSNADYKPASSKAARIGCATNEEGITGQITLANITFTGMGTKNASTNIPVVPVSFIDSAVGNPAPFSPMPSEINTKASVTFVLDILPVYYFQNKQNGSMYFFTVSEDMKNNLITNLSASWTFKGVAFYAYGTQQAGTLPVYSFQNKQNGSMYFFTVSEDMKNNLITNLSASWTFKGVAFYAYGTQQAGTLPVYSFQNKQNGSMYFFTVSEDMKNNLITNLSASWTFKGVAFYAYGTR